MIKNERVELPQRFDVVVRRPLANGLPQSQGSVGMACIQITFLHKPVVFQGTLVDYFGYIDCRSQASLDGELLRGWKSIVAHVVLRLPR
jgi:hypothetical protein